MTTEPGTAVCPNCGRAVSATDNFCEACRTELAPAAISGDGSVTASECAFCHEEHLTPDGYCESCGRKQPSARDHIEVDLGLVVHGDVNDFHATNLLFDDLPGIEPV